MSHLIADLRYGAKQLARRPGVSVVALGCLTLGIGATTAVFALVKGVLIDPLPYPAGERIVMVWETPPGTLYNPVSGPNFLDWRRQSRSFAALAAVSVEPFNLAGASEPEMVQGSRVSVDFFAVFGVSPALGRVPGPDEAVARVAVISDRLWRQRFTSSPEVLGRSISINGEAHSVVGVMPAGFMPATRWSLGERMELWLPFEVPAAPEQRGNHSWEVVGRLADGVSIGQAQAEMTAIAAELEARYPETNHDFGARVGGLKEELVGRGRTPLLLLFAAAGLVFLIVCANVAGLLLARAGARGTELALRASLGADNRRITVQLLLETVPLVVVGGVSGLLCSRWALLGLKVLVPNQAWHVRGMAIDGWSALFCLGLSVVAGVLCGAPPALLAPRRDMTHWLKSGRGGTIGAVGRHRLRSALIISQFAVALVLANAAALLLASFTRLITTDQGFDQGRLLAARLQLVGPKYAGSGQVTTFLRELLPRLRSLPGVLDAAATTKLPLYGGNNGTEIIEGREGDFGIDGGPEVERSTASPTYFQTMRIPLLDGRLLTDSDAEAPVAVINQAFARLGWPGQSALGKRFRSSERWFTVVGVVGDVRQWGPERPARPELYRLFAGAPRYDSEEYLMARPYLLLRTEREPLALASALRQVVRGLDPDQPVSDLSTMEKRVGEASAHRRFLTVLITVFAGAALVLVATGLYGLMATVVSQRTHEIGVRMALGASSSSVMALVLRQSFQMAVAGIGVGLVGVLATTPLLASQLYATRATEPWLIAAGALVLAMAATLGSIAPAWRAWRVNPAVALQTE